MLKSISRRALFGAVSRLAGAATLALPVAALTRQKAVQSSPMRGQQGRLAEGVTITYGPASDLPPPDPVTQALSDELDYLIGEHKLYERLRFGLERGQADGKYIGSPNFHQRLLEEFSGREEEVLDQIVRHPLSFPNNILAIGAGSKA